MNIADYFVWIFYTTPIFAVLTYGLYKYSYSRRALSLYKEYKQGKIREPDSLHPLFDLKKCIGCGSCAKACFDNAISMVKRKPYLLHPDKCIGHSVCRDACPVDGIKLVYGTKSRGVDIPLTNSNYQTNVPGIYIAGELGGMGLIKNAIAQGRDAIEAAAKSGRANHRNMLDVAIIGAGPAGFSATLGAIKHKLRYVTIEQDSFGGTVAHYPKGKLVMTAPAELPLAGKFKFNEIKKEPLIKLWHNILHKYKVRINTNERLEKISSVAGGFAIHTAKGTYQAKSIILAIGRRGSPRTLGVPGEDQAKVVYRLVDPAQYAGQHVLVVGGGDSALEAAHSIADETNTTVTLSYRSGSFSRAKPKNTEKIKLAQENGSLQVLFNSNVVEIKKDQVIIEQQGKIIKLKNDAVIISAGGILPTAMLKEIGIIVETKFGTE